MATRIRSRLRVGTGTGSGRGWNLLPSHQIVVIILCPIAPCIGCAPSIGLQRNPLATFRSATCSFTRLLSETLSEVTPSCRPVIVVAEPRRTVTVENVLGVTFSRRGNLLPCNLILGVLEKLITSCERGTACIPQRHKVAFAFSATSIFTR